MLISFEAFEDALLSVLKIRSTNFVNTNCDLDILLRLVYTDVAQNITFDSVKTGYLTTDEKTFKLKDDDVDSEDGSSVLTMRYGIATKIVDDAENDIDEQMIILGDYEYKLDDSFFPGIYLDRYIYFYQPITYAMEYLPVKYYDEIFNAIVEGIMYQIEVSIPSDIDGKLSNLYYQRFFNEKKRLQENHPKLDL